MTTQKYNAVIFDMDGTVLNTLDDLTDALNHALAQTGHAHAYTTADVRNFFGSGVVVAITRALAIEQGLTSYDELEAVGQPGDKVTPQIDAQEITRIQDIYKPYYTAHCAVKTGEYDGISAMIRRLREKGVKVAVVSNKPNPAVQDLAADYFPSLANSRKSAVNRLRTWSKKYSVTSAWHRKKPYMSEILKSISRRPKMPTSTASASPGAFDRPNF